MKKKFDLHVYNLLGGGKMIIITENHATGFVNHRWTFGKDEFDAE